MIVGLVSTHQEPGLAAGAIRSLLACCDTVLVQEGPVGDWNAASVTATADLAAAFKRDPRVIVKAGEYESDASKRSALLLRAHRLPVPTWAVVLDGDELLLWGEWLPDMIRYLEQKEGDKALGLSVRLVELDGSCALAGSRVYRADHVDSYAFSGYVLRLKNGVEVARPNIPLRLAGEPDLAEWSDAAGVQSRRPVHGEPHILHRAVMRDPTRTHERLHQTETRDLEAMAEAQRLGSVDTDVQDNRTGLWLPTSS